MYVKDAIRILQTLEQDAEIVIHSSNFEHNNELVTASFITQYDTGKKVTINCVDGFDNEDYNLDVYQKFGGNKHIIVFE